jgi:hypothetical protein
MTVAAYRHIHAPFDPSYLAWVLSEQSGPQELRDRRRPLGIRIHVVFPTGTEFSAAADTRIGVDDDDGGRSRCDDVAGTPTILTTHIGQRRAID